MSLHDQLLADLDDDDEFGQEEVEDEEIEEVDDAAALALGMDDEHAGTVQAVAKLAEGEQLSRVLGDIDRYSRETGREIVGAVEHDPEYKLIVEANNLTVEINSEIGVVHKYIRDNYAKRFPELEQLVQEPLDYARTVRLLKNDLDVGQPVINETLAPATVMVVSVTASTTQGELLTETELERVLEACDMALKLDDARQKIFDYVESKMYFLAPNLTHICGATTAAKLLGVAGGLTALSKMPACNVLLLGAKKQTAAGFSAANTLPHTGHVYYSDVVQQNPPEFRRKAARMVSAKISLAARVDSYRDTGVSGATVGIALRDEIEKKMDKAIEPPPAKAVKALPRPDDAVRKKRGGKRFRRQKEKNQLSDAQKAALRTNFGEIEEDEFQDEAPRAKVGVVSGRARAYESNQKVGAVSKRMQKRLQQQAKVSGGMSTIRGSNTSGTASVSFTPLQGLEIVTPHAKEEAKTAGKYIGNMKFVNVKK